MDELPDQHDAAKPNAGFVSELTSAVVGIIDKTTVEGASNFGIDVDETVGTGRIS